MSLVVVGSLALDTVETPAGSVTAALGGSGAYCALAARLLAPVHLLAVVGEDFPPAFLELLGARGVDVTHVDRVSGKSFRWGGRYGDDPNERETLFTELNVFGDWKPSLPASLAEGPHLFLANLDPELQENLRRAAVAPRLVALDTMNFWIEGKREALLATLAGVDVCIVNDSEARLLAGEHNLLRAARVIRGWGPETVVIKKGEHGALLLTSGGTFVAPAYPLAAVTDPTGAGDAFAGGFLGDLARQGRQDHAALCRAVVYGTAVASFCVEAFSVDGLVARSPAEVEERAAAIAALTRFALAGGAGSG